MGATFEVYNEQGYGMAEETYQHNPEVELGLRKIAYVSKAELDYLLVFGEIVVELKALKKLCEDHEAQLFNYMRNSRKRVGC